MARRLSAIGLLALVVVAAALLASRASAGEGPAPASRFDAPGQRHHNVCVWLAARHAALRFGDGRSTGFTVTSRERFARGCPAGTVRLDLHEVIPSSRGPLVFERGGRGYRKAKQVGYGELPTRAIASPLPPPLLSGDGRGAACKLASDGPYRVDVHSIPRAMKYKRVRIGASFSHYGDPGGDPGGHQGRNRAHYTYLLWSWIDVRGGGMVRTLLAPRQVVRPCDVAPIFSRAWDSHRRPNGWVMARYVQTVVGRCPLYGWMVWAHYDARAPVPRWVAHAVRVHSAPSSPRPAPGCPGGVTSTAP